MPSVPVKLNLGRSRLILASASPRRAQLLRDAGIPFTVVISPDHEPQHKPRSIPTALWPMCLAYMKACAVHSLLARATTRSGAAIILAADTIVVDPSGSILNKAPTRAAARRMLLRLRGRIHTIITGIALRQGDRVRLASASAECYVKKFSKHALEAYLQSDLWRGKAGAYGIQDTAAGVDPFVKLLSGEFSTVVGLPMALVQSELHAFSGACP